MSSDRIVILQRCRNEQEAAIVVGALESAGIKAQIDGALTSAMRTEVAQEVAVMVFGSDSERAQAVLQSRRPTTPAPPIRASDSHMKFFWTIVVIYMLGIIVIGFVGSLLGVW